MFVPRSFASFALLAVFVANPAHADRKETTMVPMRDGVLLATDLYIPDGEGPFPCVLSRTPYNKLGNMGTASKFVKAGFCLCISGLSRTLQIRRRLRSVSNLSSRWL